MQVLSKNRLKSCDLVIHHSDISAYIDRSGLDIKIYIVSDTCDKYPGSFLCDYIIIYRNGVSVLK